MKQVYCSTCRRYVPPEQSTIPQGKKRQVCLDCQARIKENTALAREKEKKHAGKDRVKCKPPPRSYYQKDDSDDMQRIYNYYKKKRAGRLKVL